MWNPFKKRDPVAKCIQVLTSPLKRDPVIREVSSDGENITSDESEYITWALKNEKPTCPDCQIGNLCKGPEGGASMNCMCNHCTSEFNLTLGPNWTIGERISDAGQGNPDRARTLYGINK